MSSSTKVIVVVGLILIGVAIFVRQSNVGAPKVERTVERGVH